MDLKEEVRKLVNELVENSGLSQEQVAVNMGYTKNYISDILSPSGKATDKFVKKLRSYHAGKWKKAPTVNDVDAFMVTQIVKIQATLAVLVEIAAEQEAARMGVPVTKLLSEFDKAISDKESLMRANTQ